MVKKKILIVDDEILTLQVIEFELSKAGYDVITAKDGKEAFEILNKSNDSLPDLIIADIIMPLMDGYEFCKKVKENPSTREIPFIFLTAKTAYENQIKGYLLGAQRYLTKPCSKSELMKVVNLRLKDAAQSRSLFALKSKSIQGDLSSISIFSLIEFFYVGKWSGTLSLTKEPEHGKIEFLNAEIISSSLENQSSGTKTTGEKALEALLSWQEGSFSIERKDSPSSSSSSS